MSTIIIPYIYNTYNTVVHIYIVVNLISILYFFRIILSVVLILHTAVT